MLKVWHNTNGVNKEYPVKTPEEAMKLIDALAESDLSNDGVEFNAFGLLDETGDEWNNEDAQDICEVMDERI